MSGAAERRIRVVLADDHGLVRAGFREILQLEHDIVVVAEASDGEEVVEVVSATLPDVIVLDVEMPRSDAVTTVVRLARVAPRARVLVVSMHDDPVVVGDLLRVGVAGYMLKTVPHEHFVAAVRAVHADGGRRILSISPQSRKAMDGGSAPLISLREREIMALVAAAMSNAQIARRLSITEGTVKRHLRNIFAKLNAVSRIDAVNKAVATNQVSATAAQWRPPGDAASD